MTINKNIDSNKRFNWTIARKIGGLSIILIGFILILLIYSVVALRNMQLEQKEISELDFPLTELANKIKIEQLEQQVTIFHLLQLSRNGQPDKDQQMLVEKRLNSHISKLTQHIKKGSMLSELGSKTEFHSTFATISSSLLGIQEQGDDLYPALAHVVTNINEGHFPAQQTIDEILHKGIEFDNRIQQLIIVVEDFTERELNNLSRYQQAFLMVISALGISGIFVGSILSLIVIIGIRTNLFRLTQRIAEVTHAISKNTSIPQKSVEVDSSDEIGQLGSNLSHMIDSVSKDFQRRDELMHQLTQVANTDKLTGAFNRLKWDEILISETERVKRSQDELSMILFDIDFFKKVNDKFGHDVGDHVLIEAVQLIRGKIRRTDSIFRIGGEEFVILTINTNLDHAEILANKIRQAIESYKFNIVGRVTVSMGCAQFIKDQNDDPTKMFKRADNALYKAKVNGRNQVQVASLVIDF